MCVFPAGTASLQVTPRNQSIPHAKEVSGQQACPSVRKALPPSNKRSPAYFNHPRQPEVTAEYAPLFFLPLSSRFRKKEIFEVFLTENAQPLPPLQTLSVHTSLLSSRDRLLPWEAKMAHAMDLHLGLIILTGSNDKCSN